MSLLELNYSERGVHSPREKQQDFLETSHELLSPSLPSANSNLSPKISGAVPSNGNGSGSGSGNINGDNLLTSTSNSIKGAYSDTFEAASGETVPSSVAEDNVNGSTQTISTNNPKLKDSELERTTMIEPVVKTKTNISETRVLEASEPSDEPSNLEQAARSSKKTHSESNLETEDRPETSVDYFSRQGPLVSNNKLLDVPSAKKASVDTKAEPQANSHTPQPKESLDLSDRPQASQFHSRRKLSTMLRSNSKMNYLTSTGDHTQSGKSSAPETELLRMKSAIMTKQIQKKKDGFDDETHVYGNKITEGHQNFVMAYNMLTGIRVAVSRCAGVMRKLNDSDFHETKKLTFDMDGSELTPSSKYDFKFKDYSPAVFRELRSLFGIDQADYLMSITGKYILSELGSSGKSGSFFYYSRDYRFIIKTIHHSEHKQLRRILKDYYKHVKENPNTMISQFYGLHRLKAQGGIKRVHFLVMNNLFPPHRDIHLKYDLKGSTWGRYTRIPGSMKEKDDLSSLTLKDLNWLERHDNIKFGPEKRKMFFEQLEADVKLLKRINVMDYSLLLGIHDVRKGNSEKVAKLSVFDPKSNLKSEVFRTNPRDIDRGTDLPNDVFPGRSKYFFYGHDGGIRATDEDNEPVSEIYYLGIIDCLTNYSLKKRLETAWRSLSHSRSTISAVPAYEYGDRFVKFIKDGVSDVKVKTQ